MNDLQLKAILAGICFGIWPLLMNRSGLSGNFSSLVFTTVILVCIAPFAIGHVGNLSNANWVMVVGAGVFSSLGLIFFNGMLSKTTPQNVSPLFVLMIVTQASLPAVYSIIMNNGITTTKGLGFILAIAGAVLLTI